MNGKSLRPCLRLLALAAMAYLQVVAGSARAADESIGVGLLLDLKGSYLHLAGPGSVTAARLAIEDVGGMALGRPIRVVFADHGNDPATAARIAREWADAGTVRVIADVVGSPTALAVQDTLRDRDLLTFYNGVMTPAITGKACAANAIHWMYDGYAFNQVIGGELTRLGARRWYLVVVDNQFGRDVQQSLTAIIQSNGGTVLESVTHAFGEPNLFGKLRQAAQSGADVIGLVNAGNDLIASVRQAYDLLGVSRGKIALAAVATTLTDVHVMQPPLAQGLRLTHAFYWNRDDESRAWSRRFYERTGAMPTDLQAGVYSALTHYFKAVAAAGTTESSAVVARLREIPIRDAVVRKGILRPDGRMVHDVHLLQVKKPAEISEAWDYLRILKTIPGDVAFRPLEAGECPLVAGRRP
ncbi:MAG: ABC transporter substrate-binding protein [Dechloromonas sp.]|nr:ABC transporter substrate-binding protein [Dechloromonas sp.]